MHITYPYSILCDREEAEAIIVNWVVSHFPNVVRHVKGDTFKNRYGTQCYAVN
jgi:hypothetical protein